ncbi:MAG: helix-turn-helix domain-containing protein [Betaproteobacteria bacterium]|nr:helix-turn-helix domain-containing protein [Betaproteobacteria bacterium]
MSDAPDAGAPPTVAASAGAWLRRSREEAGLSIDAVAQQLKLAPRQVKALEEGSFEELPGRTFVRGFVRNYARLLKLDPAAVVAALPSADDAPSLVGPAIGSTAPPMGELPASGASRGARVSRWAIPAALAAAIVIAAIYEFMRPDDTTRTESKGILKTAPAEPAPAPAGKPLPNPVAGDPPAGEAPAAATPPRAPASSAAPVEAVAPPAPSPAPAPAAPAAAPGEATLVIRYKANAWTQVRDASGNTILVTNGQPDGSETVHGKPPLELVIGNAADATVTWRGQPFDLAPHTRANVARVRLP